MDFAMILTVMAVFFFYKSLGDGIVVVIKTQSPF